MKRRAYYSEDERSAVLLLWRLGLDTSDIAKTISTDAHRVERVLHETMDLRASEAQ